MATGTSKPVPKEMKAWPAGLLHTTCRLAPREYFTVGRGQHVCECVCGGVGGWETPHVKVIAPWSLTHIPMVLSAVLHARMQLGLVGMSAHQGNANIALLYAPPPCPPGACPHLALTCPPFPVPPLPSPS